MLFNYMSRPQISCRTLPQPQNSPLGPPKLNKIDRMSHYKRRPPCNHECGFKIFFGSFLTFWGPNGLFLGLGLGVGLTSVLWSTYVVEQLSFSMFSSIFTFDFYLFWGIFLVLGALSGYFWGWGRVQQLIWGLLM